MSEQLEEIEHLSKELTKLTRTVKYYHQLFKKDGKISPQENDKINSINLQHIDFYAKLYPLDFLAPDNGSDIWLI